MKIAVITGSLPLQSDGHKNACYPARIKCGGPGQWRYCGMQFDMLQRCVLGDDNIVRYVKDQIGVPLDREVEVGKPMDEEWLKAHSTIFHSLVGTSLREDPEYIEYLQRIHTLRTKYGFMPKEE